MPILGAVLAAALVGGGPAQAVEREMILSANPAPLHASLMTPDGAAKGVAVLMLAGSGPTDRDGSSPALGLHADTLKLLAQGLAQAGYISLRIDKRCIGQSRAACPGESQLTLQTYVEDAVGWARQLRIQPGVSCVVILGHSEGALIADLAAAKVATCGLISISGAGRPLGAVLEDQIAASGAGPELLAQVKAIDARLAKGDIAINTPPALASLYRPSVQAYLASEIAIDPSAALASVKAPVMILQGVNDLQVTVDDARRLAEAHPGANVVVLEGVNHILKTAPADRQANLATYGRADLPLDPAVLPAVLAFLQGLGAATP